jgi:hypothetical protein
MQQHKKRFPLRFKTRRYEQDSNLHGKPHWISSEGFHQRNGSGANFSRPVQFLLCNEAVILTLFNSVM